MKYDEFIRLTDAPQPAENFFSVERAIWYILKDNWDMAHKTIQDLNTENACWIHAYLHRIEGDLDNANYWYNQSYKKPNTKSLESEINDIIKSVFM